MLYLGLAISIASIPGWTSITIPAGWAAMSALLPAATLWRGGTFSPLHLLLSLFCAWACVSALFVDGPNALWRLWQLALFALAFHLGSTLTSLRLVWIGLAIGGSISSAVAVAQWFWPNGPVMGFSIVAPAGLHYNPIMQGMILSVIAMALASEGLWLWCLPLLPGILLSQSRGALFVSVAGAMLCKVRQPLLALCFGLATVLYVTLQWSSHDVERMQIWSATFHNLSWLGAGTGSFTDLWIAYPGFVSHPEFVHNDFLQLLYEHGVGSIFLLAILAAALALPNLRSWPPAAAIAIFSCFTFPLYSPITAFALALCAGHASADRSLSWGALSERRLALLSFIGNQRSRWSSPGRKALAAEL